MNDTCSPSDPDTLADQMGDLPTAVDRVRLIGLDHSARLQQGRLGATERRLALAQARRPDDGETIALLESKVVAEMRAQRSLGLAVQTAEIDVPARSSGIAVIHGRVLDQQGAPADGLTVAAIDANGRVARFACTDAKGYFRLDLPVGADRADRVFLQVSDGERGILYRGEEAIALADQGVTYRVINLGAPARPPCPAPPDKPTMPDLIGQKEEAALAILGRLGLKLAQRLTQPDADRVGLVIAQEPSAGAVVNDATSVTLTIGIAEPSEAVKVPDMIGQPREEAEKLLREADLKLGRIATRPGDKPGTVLSQDPKAGTAVAPGSAVALVIAVEQPDERVTVPELVGKSLDDAASLLKQAGLDRGQVALRDHPRAGLVLEQRPAAGTPVEKGSTVDLVLARQSEVEATQVPDLKDSTLGAAATLLKRAQLQLGETSGPRTGRVTEQKPAAGDRASVGSTVDVALAASRSASREKAVDQLSQAIEAEDGFADLGIEGDTLRKKLADASIDSTKSAQDLGKLSEADLQERLNLKNRKQAGAFKRMLRAGLKRL